MRCRALLLVMVFMLSSTLLAEGMRVGVVEFEERGEIDLQDAGKIVAELLAENLVNVGKYDIAERVLLTRVLEEQKLAVMGVVDESFAPKIGQVYGLDGVVVGFCMGVGGELTISARLVDASTGKILEASTVRLRNLRYLRDSLRVVAYELSGISRQRLRVLDEELVRKAIGGGALLGVGYGFDSDNGDPALCIPIGIEFYSRFVDANVLGFPVGNITGIVGFLTLTPGYMFGIDIGYGFLYGDLSGSPVRGEFGVLWFGWYFSPSYRLKIHLCMGGVLTGNIRCDDGREGDVDGVFVQEFPGSNWMFEIDCGLTKQWGARLFFIQMGAEDENISEYFHVGSLGLMMKYSFSLTKG